MSSIKKAEVFNNKLKKQKALKLDNYAEAIIYLLEKNTSILAIQKYLFEKEKVTVSYSNLYKYIKKIDLSTKSKISDKSDYQILEEYCQKLKDDFIPKSEHYKYKSVKNIIDFFVQKSQQTQFSEIKNRDIIQEESSVYNNIKSYTIGSKVTKKLNLK
ncbi:hypothetical protein [Aliarcobacter butzleri]|uniref:hypothetical protein n=1 Tax=Aliarcobacter butzleri TaxID=28197 RepID=UPI003AF7BBDF